MSNDKTAEENLVALVARLVKKYYWKIKTIENQNSKIIFINIQSLEIMYQIRRSYLLKLQKKMKKLNLGKQLSMHIAA